MTQLFGWHDIATGEEEAARLIASTCRPHNTTSRKQSFCIHTEHSALASNSHHCASSGRLYAAITGKPQWTEATLQQHATEKGAAASLLTAYKRYGHQLFLRLQGAFAFAILDLDNDSLLLAVDRIGIHSLYYAPPEAGGGTIFGSSLNTIVNHPAMSTSVDPQALYNYIYFRMVPSPGTIYSNVRKLQPSQFVELSANGIDTGFYWNPDFTDIRQESFPELSKQLKAHLQTAIKNCLSGTSSGAFLSGGIDSSTVVGLLSDLQEEPVQAFSIGFEAEGYDEMEFARSTARHYRAQLHEYYVTPTDVINLAPRIAQSYDEPFGNSSVIPTYFCARLAKEHGISQILAGDGGDELFAGNTRYVKQKIFELYGKLPAQLRNHVLEPLITHFPKRGKIAPIRKAYSYIEQANTPLPLRLESYNLMERTDLRQILDSDFLATIDYTQPHELANEVYRRAQTNSFINKILYHDWKITLADNDLRKVNGMCTLAGIKVAYPLLDDELIQFSTTVPPDMKISGLRLRHFFKQAMKDFLPPHTMVKSKHGFGLPFGVWLKSSPQLQELAYDTLSTMKRRKILQDSFIDNLINIHQNEHASFYGEMIWVIMMLELWLTAHHK